MWRYAARLLVATRMQAATSTFLVELDETRPIGIFEYARLRLYMDRLLGGTSDVANRRTLKPLLRDSILRDAVNAF